MWSCTERVLRPCSLDCYCRDSIRSLGSTQLGRESRGRVKRYVPDSLRRAARRCVRGREHRSEAGDTLLEVLIALVVLGMASVALLVSFATSISASSTYRDVATLDSVLRTASEEVITQIQQQ